MARTEGSAERSSRSNFETALRFAWDILPSRLLPMRTLALLLLCAILALLPSLATAGASRSIRRRFQATSVPKRALQAEAFIDIGDQWHPILCAQPSLRD